MRSSRSAELDPPNGRGGYHASPPARGRAPAPQTRTPRARGSAIGLPQATAQYLCADSPGRETGHAAVARSRRLPDIFVQIPRLLLALDMRAAQLEFSPSESLPLRVRVATMRSLLRYGRLVRTLRATIPNSPVGLASTSRVVMDHPD